MEFREAVYLSLMRRGHKVSRPSQRVRAKGPLKTPPEDLVTYYYCKQCANNPKLHRCSQTPGAE